MDWKKVEELRKKVLAEEEELVKEAIKGDKRRKKMGGPIHAKAKKSGGVRNLDEEQERRVREFFGWNPDKDGKKKRR